MTDAKHPMQPVVLDEHGTPRFLENGIVRFLLDMGPFDLNKLAVMRANGQFTNEDYTHLMQLIGYSVDGYAELSTSPEELIQRADVEAGKLLKKGQPPEVKKTLKKAVALDFDGVLHAYTSKWTVPEEIHDGPTPGALEAVKEYLAAGMEVVVFSARARSNSGMGAMMLWLEDHGFPYDEMPITSVKPSAQVYIDDRGFQFNGTFPSAEELLAFRPWNRR